MIPECPIGALIADIIDEASLTTRTDLIRFERCPTITGNAERDKIGSVISNLISNAINIRLRLQLSRLYAPPGMDRSLSA
jgi:signal transduction histidine kinase